jgi:hypothetical protein
MVGYLLVNLLKIEALAKISAYQQILIFDLTFLTITKDWVFLIIQELESVHLSKIYFNKLSITASKGKWRFSASQIPHVRDGKNRQHLAAAKRYAPWMVICFQFFKNLLYLKNEQA